MSENDQDVSLENIEIDLSKINDKSGYTVGYRGPSGSSSFIYTSPPIGSFTSSTINTITTSASGTSSTISYNPTASYTISNGYSGYSGSVNINDTNGITMKDNLDIKIGDRSLKEFMIKMEERLAILVPDPNKLEKFQALKKAYEHYKTLESLCIEEPKEEDK